MDIPELGKKLIISREIKYSPVLVRTPNMNYYQIKEQLPAGYRMSTASEERALQRTIEEARKDPRKAKVFDDLFARNKDETYVWQWTETGLRVPKGWENGKYETDEKGEKRFPRILLLGKNETGKTKIPEGDGKVITEWYEDSGLPKETKEMKYPHKPYTTHFVFDSNPGKDPISGHHDVAVGRGSGWRRGEGVGCLCVGAGCRRLGAGSDAGFRPVQGSLIEVGSEDIERALLEKIRKDFVGLPFKEFQERYNL